MHHMSLTDAGCTSSKTCPALRPFIKYGRQVDRGCYCSRKTGSILHERKDKINCDVCKNNNKNRINRRRPACVQAAAASTRASRSTRHPSRRLPRLNASLVRGRNSLNTRRACLRCVVCKVHERGASLTRRSLCSSKDGRRVWANGGDSSGRG